MRFGAAVVSGIFSILAVTFAVQIVPWIRFPWLDEAIFIGYLVTGQVALAPVVAAFPLVLVGGGTALLAWRWAEGKTCRGAFFAGFWAALILYALAVAVTNPFISMFQGFIGETLPMSIQHLLSPPGFASVLPGLWGHIVFGIVLGVFLSLATAQQSEAAADN